MRISDVEKLTWEDIEHNKEAVFIRFKHQKTKNQQTLPITQEAFELLDKENTTGLVFKDFKRRDRVLKQWAKDAGIIKNISWHKFRHTNATMLLNSGASIFTVKELLGHKNIKTTMNYVNLMDKSKIDAVNAISFKKKGE